MSKEPLLFLSHNVKHQRCQYLLNSINSSHQVKVPWRAALWSSRLSLSGGSASNMLLLGISALRSGGPIHLDGIDVFIYPFLVGAAFLHDYHVPLVPELRWLGLTPLAIIAHNLMPESIKNADVLIAPNHQMLAHASEYAKLPEYHVIPNYPPKSFYKKISTDKARNNLGLNQDAPIALFVGGARLREIYGIDLLLETWPKVRRKVPDALIYIIGPYEQLGYSPSTIELCSRKGINFVGKVDHKSVPERIASADVCVSQRTPGFPSRFYNTKDSVKLSEYAIFKKPIVTAGYGPDPDYISADTTPESYAEAIARGFAGEAPTPTPHTWEENFPVIRKAYDQLMS